MKRTVILCRHGNTFNPGEKVVMVGAREDLPLTEFGREQARVVGAVVARILKDSNGIISEILTGPLSRTFEFASIIAHEARLTAAIQVDDRLKELDYGEWGGLSNDEIVSRSGEQSLRNWQEQGVRPRDIQFIPSAEDVECEIQSLLQELSAENGIALAVTSNGRLREFARLISGGQQRAAKVKTGHLCVIEWSSHAWNVRGWDMDPKDVERLMRP